MQPTRTHKLRLQPHHIAWLSCHPERTAEWLSDRLADNFHVHHVDGDHSNDEPRNLVLIEGLDHMLLFHGMRDYAANAVAGRRGGLARAKNFTSKQLSRMASKAQKKRWKRARAAKRSGEIHKAANETRAT